MSAVYARCIQRFLYRLCRVEISVYAVYPDMCGPVYFCICWHHRLSFLCNAHALLTNPLRCLDTNRIRVDGRIRYVWTQIFLYPHKKICGYKNLRIHEDGALLGKLIDAWSNYQKLKWRYHISFCFSLFRYSTQMRKPKVSVNWEEAKLHFLYPTEEWN